MATNVGTIGFAHATTRRWLALAGIASLLLLVLARASGVTDVAVAQTFTIIFTAIVVEALPFVLLGAVVSAAIEVYVSDDVLGRVTRLPAALQLPAAALGGFAFPVCECGSVPVARRLMRRGMHPGAGIAFMLASPIFNPIVLLATWVAYSPRGLGMQMVAGRALLGLVVALATGWALGGEAIERLLRSDVQQGGPPARAGSSRRLGSFFEHLNGDFFFMGKFLVVGAALSAAFQTLLPQSLVAGVARSAVVGTLALMAIAYVSSLCSEADAFVAVSFSQFGLGSQLAFLVFGPILDFKLTFLYGAAFRQRFVGTLVVVAVPLVLAGALVFEVVIR
ncbi:MAG: permease [Actinomycetota bacterium]|nr:permease [Actinomycetota bacterium]